MTLKQSAEEKKHITRRKFLKGTLGIATATLSFTTVSRLLKGQTNQNSDLKVEIHQLTSGGDNCFPDTDGKYVVFQNRRKGKDPLTYIDLETGKSYSIPSKMSDAHDRRPREGISIDNGKVVWEDIKDGNTGIYMFDIDSEDLKRLTDKNRVQIDPQISGNYVVSTDKTDPEKRGEIYIHCLENDEGRIITNDEKLELSPTISAEQGEPEVFEDEDNIVVTYTDDRTGFDNIFMRETGKNLKIGEETQITDSYKVSGSSKPHGKI